MSRFERVALVGIVALAAGLRFATLGLQSLDFDEAYTVQIVGGSLGHMFHQVPVTESTPPLFYVLAWVWGQLFGVGAVGLRTLSALLGTLVVPVAFAAGRRLGGRPRRAGGGGAGGGQSADGLVLAGGALLRAALTALRAVVLGVSGCAWSGREPRRWPAGRWPGGGAGDPLLRRVPGGGGGGLAAVALAAARRSVVPRSAVVAAAGAALVPLAVDQASHNRTEWIEALSLPARVREVGKKWLTGEIGPTRAGSWCCCWSSCWLAMWDWRCAGRRADAGRRSRSPAGSGAGRSRCRWRSISPGRTT